MKVVVSDEALERFDRALDWYEGILSERQMLGIVDDVRNAVAYLAAHPGAGQFEPWLDHEGKGARRWIVGHFKIIYRVSDGTLHITDIFDSRQDPRRMKG
jgi:plasmid stabilization system protein ParE